ncbi:MAG: hypothetical protein KY461_13880 [Actinobacteria bacterium]|nr:hypothetical protein [Actinomycetota bacterium]
MDAPGSPPRIELIAVDGPPRPCIRLRRGDQHVDADVSPTGDLLQGVAETTLDAVVELLPQAVTLSLEQLHVLASPRPVVVVVVLVTVAGVGIPHTGSALVGEQPELAAAKATLAAINRRLEILPT